MGCFGEHVSLDVPTARRGLAAYPSSAEPLGLLEFPAGPRSEPFGMLCIGHVKAPGEPLSPPDVPGKPRSELIGVLGARQPTVADPDGSARCDPQPHFKWVLKKRRRRFPVDGTLALSETAPSVVAWDGRTD